MKRITSVLLLLLLGLLLSGCAGGSKGGSGYQVYYTDVGRSGLQTEVCSFKSTQVQEMIGEALDRMAHPVQTGEHFSLLPEGVEITDYALTDGQLTVTFNEMYLRMDNVAEILLRAGLVGTVTQFGEVRTVVFHIGSDVLRDRSGEPVGAMTRSMFVNNPVGINSYQYASLTLYFSNAAGDRLVKEMRNIHYSSNTTLEKIVVEQLLKGPMNQQLKPVLAEDVKCHSVTVQDRTCTVNLDQSFLDQNVGAVTAEVTVYAIVNSLCDVLNVDKIQFQVDGDSSVTYGGSLSFAGPFHRNSDIIVTQKEMGTVESGVDDNAILGEPSIGL